MVPAVINKTTTEPAPTPKTIAAVKARLPNERNCLDDQGKRLVQVNMPRTQAAIRSSKNRLAN